MPFPRRVLVRGAAAAAACGLAAISFAVTAEGSDARYAGLQALARALTVAVPALVGLAMLERPPLRRFGRLLLATGGGWFLTTLAGSDQSLAYSTGRVAAWVMLPVLLAVTLSFPAGRVPARADRALVAGAAIAVAILGLPIALLAERYPDPSPWSACGDGCPPNAFQITATDPSWVVGVAKPIGQTLVILLLIAAALRLAQRIRTATPAMRQMLTPVLGVAVFGGVISAAALLLRTLAPGAATALHVGWWLTVGASIALSLSFLAGALRWRLFVGASLSRLAEHVRADPSPAALRDALADAFADPGLELRAAGGCAEPPPGRACTEIREDGQVVAVVVHDPVLRQEPAFVEAVGAAAALQELYASRARVLAGADDERQRIQRDLHDGAQQRLVALRVRLDMSAAGEAEVDRDALLAFAREVDAAIDETRDFAYGVYPPLLASRGLTDALRSAATRMPLATRVVANGIPRYPEAIERAAYFCTLEAMQNAAKHAHGATAVTVRIVDDGVLRVGVHDDGGGFDAAAAPLTSLRDRIASVGGQLAIESGPRNGTRVAITLPSAT
jgi:signal transduction histidine kinase